ncbi:MAG: antibiotic acetyltransferase, partial [Bacillota bacterium]|nr:antibiotic acetyltransferase [Bacillota bacterium]
VVAGVPARVIRYRFSPEEIEKLMRFRWWERDPAWLRAHAEEFADAQRFLKTYCGIGKQG